MCKSWRSFQTFSFLIKDLNKRKCQFCSKSYVLKANRFLEKSKDSWMKSVISYEELA